MPFFTYRQNNSNAFYKGSVLYVCVEADNASEADELSAEHGVYFEDREDDCHGCPMGGHCGSRWSTAYGEGDEQPESYGDYLPDQQKAYIIAYKNGKVLTGGVPLEARKPWQDLYEERTGPLRDEVTVIEPKQLGAGQSITVRVLNDID